MPRVSKKQVHMGKLLASGDLAYTDCIACPDRDVTCKGPNLAVLDSDSYRAWIQLMMDHLGWSHADLADASGVSKGTIDSWLSGHSLDLRRDSSWRIARALFGNREVCAPCPLNAQGSRELSAKAAAHDAVKAESERRAADDRAKIEHLKQQNADQAALIKEHMHFFRRKNTVMAILGVLLGIAVCVIIAALLIDAMNPNIGFFWVK